MESDMVYKATKFSNVSVLVDMFSQLTNAVLGVNEAYQVDYTDFQV